MAITKGTLADLLLELKQANILVRHGMGDTLDIVAEKTSLTSEIILKIKSHKSALQEYLHEVNLVHRQHEDIPVTMTPGPYPLSPAQQRLWIIQRMDPDATTYNMPNTLEINQDLDPRCFEKALHAVVERHEILRTIFRQQVDGHVMQYVLDISDAYPDMQCLDYSHRSDSREAIERFIQQDRLMPFDLSLHPPLRVRLYKYAPQRFILYFNMHHIIGDGWSMNVLQKDILRYYTIFREGGSPNWSPLKIQYKDVAIWQRGELEGPGGETHRSFWRGQFTGELPILQLPFARQRVISDRGADKTLGILLDANDTAAFRQCCQHYNASLFIGLLTLLYTLLYRYTGMRDLIVGTPVAGRDHLEMEDQIGCYINTLAIRCRFTGDTTFATLLQTVRQKVLGAYDHQVYPFDSLVADLGTAREVNRHPLFDIMIALQNQQERPVDISRYPTDQGVFAITDAGKVKFDIDCNFSEGTNGLYMQVGYQCNLYHQQDIVFFMRHFAQLIRSVVKAPDCLLDDLGCMDAAEQHDVCYSFNATRIPYASDTTIPGIIRQLVERDAESIAVVWQGRQYSYRQLDDDSHRLAQRLIKKGVRQGELVPVCDFRSYPLIVGMLAVLNAGAAYVPIDPSYPRQRIAYMLRDSRARFVLTTREHQHFLPEGSWETLLLEDIEDASGPVMRTPHLLQPSDLAYVIYTSGSSGTPKGVMVEHRSVINLVQWHARRYNVSPDSRSTMMAGVGFDAGALELWSALLNGTRLYVLDEETRLESKKLLAFYSTEHITHAFVPPALIPGLIGSPQPDRLALQFILIGGEKLGKMDLSHISYRLINQYGPTEATVMVTDHWIGDREEDAPPIGKPLANARIYLLDAALRHVPIGMPGEICLGGTPLARGYWQQKELTAAAFIPDPLLPGERIYRTGDLGRWQPDGSIVYMGRADEQLKIRGNRVEPDEVAKAMERFVGAGKAVVVGRQLRMEEGLVLIGYYVSPGILTAAQWRQRLRELLPPFMRPSFYVQLPEWPLTPNGKIDKEALPLPHLQVNTHTDLMPARNENQRRLAGILASLLNQEPDQIDIYDNFFDLGATSMTLIKFADGIRAMLGHDIRVVTLFRYPNIQSLSDILFTDDMPLRQNAHAPGIDTFPDHESIGQELDQLFTDFDM